MSTTKYYEFGFKNNLWNKKTSNIGIVPSKGTRYPIRGYYRKTLECCDNNKQKLTLKINKDNYSKCSDKTICDRKGRTSKPIIRSGMQPKKQTRESQAKINALETELATLDKFTNKLKDIDNGIIIMNNRLKENQKKIKKNQVELKSASNMVKNEANSKMKELDSM